MNGENKQDQKHIKYNNYCVLPNVISGTENGQERISQILHISSNIMDDRVVDQVNNWNGPVSMTIVLMNQDHYHCIVQKLNEFLSRNHLLRRFLRVHLMFPSSWSEICRPEFKASACNISKLTHQELANYPVNTARNAARMFSPAKYILIADFEHLFSKNFERDVLEIAKTMLQKRSKHLLVYRIFEVAEEAREPENKKDLKELMKEKKAIIFHGTFSKSHVIPRLEEWFEENGTETGIFWENVPYTPKFEQRWELCRAGYQLDVISNHFMYHKGIKKVMAQKAQALNHWKFSKALKAWNARMDTEYVDTKQKCPRGNY